MSDQGGSHRLRIDNGFDNYKSIDNTAAPGVLVHSTASGKKAYLCHIIATNDTGSTQTLTLYDEDSNEIIVLILDDEETTSFTVICSTGVPINDKDIYARISGSGNVDLTISGVEI